VAATIAMFQPEIATTWLAPTVVNAAAGPGRRDPQADQDPRREPGLGLGDRPAKGIVGTSSQALEGPSGITGRAQDLDRPRPKDARGTDPMRYSPYSPSGRGSGAPSMATRSRATTGHGRSVAASRTRPAAPGQDRWTMALRSGPTLATTAVHGPSPSSSATLPAAGPAGR
jgi:hypothetical protein